MPTIQVLSDTHLEYQPHLTFHDLLVPTAQILVLAGNIGNPKESPYHEFITTCSMSFEWVIIICGSYDYRLLSKNWNWTVLETDLYMMALATSFPNVLYLAHGENIEVCGINFIGATLWTPQPDSLASTLNTRYIKQFLDAETPWSVSVQNKLHKEHLQTIIEKTERSSLPNVVITHHAPLNDPISYNVALWIHGHTSTNNVDVCTNQRGRGARSLPLWRKDYVVHVQ